MNFLFHWLKVLIGSALLIGSCYAAIYGFLFLSKSGTVVAILVVALVLITILAAVTYPTVKGDY